MTKPRIRLQLEGGQWTYWLSDEQLKAYCVGNKAKSIKAVVIEETMSYDEAMNYIKDFGK